MINDEMEDALFGLQVVLYGIGRIMQSRTMLGRHSSSVGLKTKKALKIEKENLAPPFLTKHPASKFLRGTNPDRIAFEKFTMTLYRGLQYATFRLKGPSKQFIEKKKVVLPEPTESKKKFLFMDLDETLIHSVFTDQKVDVKFRLNDEQFRFNVRPYCTEFLQQMSELYTIYVFTAGTQDYAEPIVEYLNKKKKYIHGVLHRKNCMETHNGYYIKDLRIVQNRELKDIIIVDNLVHSFGLQLSNGIPILEFLNNKDDKEFLGLIDLLKTMHDVEDVRDHILNKIKLSKILNIDQTQFLEIQEYKNR